MLADIPDPYKPVSTTGEVVQALTDYRGAFDVCRVQVKGIRDFTAEALKPKQVNDTTTK